MTMTRVQNALIALALIGPFTVWSEVSAQSAGGTIAVVQAQASKALAQEALKPIPAGGVSVALDVAGEKATILTKARTVGAVLAELNITPGPADDVVPAADTAVTPNMQIAYRPSINATLVADGVERTDQTTTDSVGDFLRQEHIALGRYDRVSPAVDAPVPDDGVVKVQRVTAWSIRVSTAFSLPTVRRRDAKLAYGKTKVLQAAHVGIREQTVLVGTVDGRREPAKVLRSHIVRHAQPMIIAVGTRRSTPQLAAFAQAAFSRTAAFAHGALSMMATAYTAYCDGCSGTGRGATGIRIGHGIVAVDPRIIPLGSHLYIPGYGQAIAGDTGSSIIGHRVDLAMDSNREALNFGRRAVTIYLLDGKSKH